MGTRKTLENMQTAIDNAYDSIEEMGGDVPQARNLVNLSGTIDDLQNSVIAGVRGTNDAYQSTGKSYTKGESCIYNNVVYTAKDAISAPAGEFDPSKWDESSLASLRSSISDISNYSRRTRKNITNNLANLSTAIAEQNLEKYGYTIGDYFVGASGYTYHLADMDCNYGGYNSCAVVSTHHCGVVVDTHATSKWADSVTNYSSSILHTYLSGTVLNNIKSDFNALFGGWSNHLIARTELDNSVGGWGTTWEGLANCLICAMTEVQVYGSRVFGCDGFQTGTGSKPLELFMKYRFNEIYGNTWIWLKSLYSASNACYANYRGVASFNSVGFSSRVSGLILFK